MLHELKIRKEFADSIITGLKTFEVRENDRGFNAGDRVRFKAVDDCGVAIEHPINRDAYEITYVLSGWGIESGYVVFSIMLVGDYK